MSERGENFKAPPEWMEKSINMPKLSSESVRQWADLILEKVQDEVIHLENHWELFPLLEVSFEKYKREKGEGADFKAHARNRIMQELRKLLV